MHRWSCNADVDVFSLLDIPCSGMQTSELTQIALDEVRVVRKSLLRKEL